MSGFEAAAGVAGLLSLTLQVCSGLVKYYEAFSSYDEIHAVLARLTRLRMIVASLEDITERLEAKRFETAGAVNVLVSHLEKGHEKLKKCLEQCQIGPGNGMMHSLKSSSKRAVFPLKKGQVSELQQHTERLASDLVVAIGTLHLDIDLRHIEFTETMSRDLTSLKHAADHTSNTLADVQSLTQATRAVVNDLDRKAELGNENLNLVLEMLGQISRSQDQSNRLLSSQNHLALQLLQKPSALQSMIEATASLDQSGPSVQSATAHDQNAAVLSLASTCNCRPHDKTSWNHRKLGQFQFYQRDRYTSKHRKGCPYHLVTEQTRSYGFRIKLRPFLNNVIDVCYSLNVGAGGHAVGPWLSLRTLLREHSPVFKAIRYYTLNHRLGGGPSYYNPLLELIHRSFETGEASPYDVDEYGRNALHLMCHTASWPSKWSTVEGRTQVVMALIDAGVPLMEPGGSAYLTRPVESLFREIAHYMVLEKSIESSWTVCSYLLGQCDDVELNDYNLAGLETVQYLRCADIELLEQYGLSAISIAILKRDVESVRAIIQQAIVRGKISELFKERYFGRLNILHLSYDWPEGLSILLDHGFQVLHDQHDAHNTEPILYTIQCFDSRALAQYIERDIFPWSDSPEGNRFEILLSCPDLSFESYKVAILALAKHRRVFLQFARKCLPGCVSIEKIDGVPDGLDLRMIRDRLAEAGVEIPEGLAVHHDGTAYDFCALRRWFRGAPSDTANVFELLWITGFRDLNTVGRLSGSALHHCVQSPSATKWLLDRGAMFSSPLCSVDGLTIWHMIGSVYTGPLYHYLTDVFFIGHTGAEFWWKSIASSNSEDACICACSAHGCLPLSNIFRGFPAWSHSTWWAKIDIDGPSLGRYQAESLIRLATFEVLNLTHTCCTLSHEYNGPEDYLTLVPKYKPLDAEEIRDEEHVDIQVLEDLLEDFLPTYNQRNESVGRFLHGYWAPRMLEMEKVIIPVSHESQVRILELGINLFVDEAKDAADSYSYLERMAKWVGEDFLKQTKGWTRKRGTEDIIVEAVLERRSYVYYNMD